MKTTSNIFYLIIILILFGCRNEVDYKPAKAIVIKTEHRHWGKGNFKLEVYYKYFNGTDTVINQVTAKGMERSYTAKYIIGDSLLIGFNPSDSSDSYISKKIYNKTKSKKLKHFKIESIRN